MVYKFKNKSFRRSRNKEEVYIELTLIIFIKKIMILINRINFNYLMKNTINKIQNLQEILFHQMN